LDDRYVEVEKVHGVDGARRAAESHTAAIDRIEQIAQDEAIDCEFLRVDGYLFLAPEQSGDLLDRELAAAHRAGVTNVEMLARAPLSCFDTGRCLRFPHQAQLHPLKYMAGLARAFVEKGGRIFGTTHASKIDGGNRARVATSAGPVVAAGAIVVATNTPV